LCLCWLKNDEPGTGGGADYSRPGKEEEKGPTQWKPNDIEGALAKLGVPNQGGGKKRRGPPRPEPC